MDELIQSIETLNETMQEVLSQLQEISNKIDNITGYGPYNAISDICSKLDDISNSGVYSLQDVCSKLDSIDSSISSLETTIDLKD